MYTILTHQTRKNLLLELGDAQMSNANHSWDGKQLTGTISGFSQYSTGETDTADKSEVVNTQ